MGDDAAARSAAGRTWAALEIEATRLDQNDLIAATLDDYSPAAIEDLAEQPLPPGGLWDPTFPPVPEPDAAPLRWRVFFAAAEDRDRAAAALAKQFPDVQTAAADVPDEDWASRSQRSLKAIRVGRFVVAPPWDLPSSSDAATITIVIEPSRGFGTGHHPSTRLCLRALSDLDVRGRRVLDLGTGSGVLAMAAAFSGAGDVFAVDVDPDAIDSARASAALNALPVEVRFAVADFRTQMAALEAGHRDILLANLTGGMLVQSRSQIIDLLAPGGLLVMSGFDASERPGVLAAFGALQEVASYAEDGWESLVLKSRS